MTADVYLTAELWIGLALAALLISIRIGVSVALLEIGMGIIGGNFLHLQRATWIDFLASFGSVVLTFLAGAEIDPALMCAKFKESAGIGFVSFLLPFLGAFLINQTQYTILVTVVIMSAVLPTLIGQAFFRPQIDTGQVFAPLAVEAEDDAEVEVEVEAAEPRTGT